MNCFNVAYCHLYDAYYSIKHRLSGAIMMPISMVKHIVSRCLIDSGDWQSRNVAMYDFLTHVSPLFRHPQALLHCNYLFTEMDGLLL